MEIDSALFKKEFIASTVLNSISIGNQRIITEGKNTVDYTLEIHFNSQKAYKKTQKQWTKELHTVL
jgi:hypothetical protein